MKQKLQNLDPGISRGVLYSNIHNLVETALR